MKYCAPTAFATACLICAPQVLSAQGIVYQSPPPLFFGQDNTGNALSDYRPADSYYAPVTDAADSTTSSDSSSNQTIIRRNDAGTAIISQSGPGNSAIISQSGSGNSTITTQSDSGSSTITTHSGSGNSTIITQQPNWPFNSGQITISPGGITMNTPNGPITLPRPIMPVLPRN